MRAGGRHRVDSAGGALAGHGDGAGRHGRGQQHADPRVQRDCRCAVKRAGGKALPGPAGNA